MIIQKSLFIGLASTFSGIVAAQAAPPPGWNVVWGMSGASVPVMSPWAMALLAGLLSVAAFAFLRKRAHFGLMALAVAVLAGGLATYSSDQVLASANTTTLELNKASGSADKFCGVKQITGATVSKNGVSWYLIVENKTTAPIIINSVTPLYGPVVPVKQTANAARPAMAGQVCAGGVELKEAGQGIDSTCNLECTVAVVPD